jgi:hypothetical protein
MDYSAEQETAIIPVSACEENRPLLCSVEAQSNYFRIVEKFLYRYSLSGTS